jgi:redox-sensitive bicupin YhaK (pirin superfamily)
MAKKTISEIVKPGAPHFVGDGFRVHNFIPGASTMQEMDPFILLDYNSKYNFTPSEIPRGVGVHPHKGFETVTIAYKGSVEHSDSTGNGGVIYEGDVQWMTAANGILHKEFHEKNFSKKGGIFQMVQLWVNLPAKYKNNEPGYQSLHNAKLTKVSLNEGNSLVEVIAGNYDGHEGSAHTFTPVHLLNVKLKKGNRVPFNFPENYTTALLVIEGSVLVNGTDTVLQDHFAKFNRDGESFWVEALEDSVVLVMSGEPIREPIEAHGPFVMNTKAEIIQAFDDFNRGKFGYLED